MNEFESVCNEISITNIPFLKRCQNILELVYGRQYDIIEVLIYYKKESSFLQRKGLINVYGLNVTLTEKGEYWYHEGYIQRYIVYIGKEPIAKISISRIPVQYFSFKKKILTIYIILILLSVTVASIVILNLFL